MNLKLFGLLLILSYIFSLIYVSNFRSSLQNIKDPKKFAALKAESNDVEGGSAIKLEIAVLLTLHGSGEQPHIPVLYQLAKRKRFSYMVITLLGPSLKALKAETPQDKLSAKV